MHRILRLFASATFGLLASATTAVSQARPLITVAFEDAPLQGMVQSFAAFSGRSITIAPGVSEATLSGYADRAPWEHAFDQLLATRSLIARPSSNGGLRVERERRVTLEFEDAPLGQVLRSIADYSGYLIVSSGDLSDLRVTAGVRDVDWQRALNEILTPMRLVARPDTDAAFHVRRR
jgi:type II secretory pathway component HofQ